MNTLEFNNENLETIIQLLQGGEVLVLPSDTLYGFSCLAKNATSVEQIYNLKQREHNKPFIILISNQNDLKTFGINLNSKQNAFLNNNWPAPLTVVFDTSNKELEYLHRGGDSLGFRIPDNKLLLKLINKVGPIVSTTVNISGQPPALTIEQAQKIFKDKITTYVDNGKMESEPSTVVKFEGDEIKIIREGSGGLNRKRKTKIT